MGSKYFIAFVNKIVCWIIPNSSIYVMLKFNKFGMFVLKRFCPLTNAYITTKLTKHRNSNVVRYVHTLET